MVNMIIMKIDDVCNDDSLMMIMKWSGYDEDGDDTDELDKYKATC